MMYRKRKYLKRRVTRVTSLLDTKAYYKVTIIKTAWKLSGRRPEAEEPLEPGGREETEGVKAERSRRGRAAGLPQSVERGKMAELKRVPQEIQSRLLPSASVPAPFPSPGLSFGKMSDTAVADTPPLNSKPQDLTDAWRPPSLSTDGGPRPRASPPVRFASGQTAGLLQTEAVSCTTTLQWLWVAKKWAGAR